MPPKRTHGRKSTKPPSTVAGAMSDCVLPQDLMLCILTRLPVKSIHRFKSVCKPWRTVFSTPKFAKMHHDQLSRNPENQSVIVYSGSSKGGFHTMSVFRFGADGMEQVNLDLPFARRFVCVDLV